MKNIYLFLLTLCTTLSFSQNIKGLTKVKGADGQDFQLVDSVEVYTYPPKGGQFKIGINVLVEESQFNEEDSTLLSDSEFFNVEKETLGKSLSQIKVTEFKRPEPYRLRNYYWVHLEGEVSQRNIHRKTIVNEELFEAMNNSKRGLRGPELEEFIQRFNFTLDESSELPVYVYLRKNKDLKEDPSFRIILIMRGSTLLCVISNEVEFPVKEYKAIEEGLGYTFTYFSKPNSRLKEQILDIAYKYTPL